MKYWFGYLTAAIFGAITWVLMRFGERFSTLVDMVYPYVIRTSESILAQWASSADFPVWQLLAVALGALILASIVLMIVLKWNPIQWGGWVLAFFAGIYMLHTMLWGLNYYSGPLSDDMRLDVGSYNLEELTEATEYYRDKANALALQVNATPICCRFARIRRAGRQGRRGLPDADLRLLLSHFRRFHPSGEEAGLGGYVFLHGHHRRHLRPDRRGLRQSPDPRRVPALYHVPRNGPPHVHRPGTGRQFCRVPRRLRPFRPGIPVQRLLYGLPLLLQRPEQRQ